MKYTKKIIIILFAIVVMFLGSNNILYSDEAAYASAGLKLLGYNTFSHPIWPIFMPFVFAFFFRLNLEFIAVNIFIPLLAIGSAMLVYKISEDIWGQKTAIIALLLFVTSGKIISFSGQFLTEISTIFFALLAFYTFGKKHYAITALSVFFSITTRWFNIIIAIPFILLLIYKKRFKELSIYVSALSVTLILLLSYFYVSYGDPLHPINQLPSIGADTEYPLFVKYPVLYDFYYIFFIPFIFAIPGLIILLYMAFKNRKRLSETVMKDHYFIILGIILLNILIYSMFPSKIARYLFLSVPFGLMLVARAIAKIETRKIAISAFIIILIFNIFANAYPDDLQTGISDFFSNNIPKEDVQNALNLSRQGISICASEVPKNFTRFDGFKNITEKIGRMDAGYYTLGFVNETC